MTPDQESGRRPLQQYLPFVRFAFLAVTAVATAALAIDALNIGWKVGAAMAGGLYLSVITYLLGKIQGAQEGYTEAKIEEWRETLYDEE